MYYIEIYIGVLFPIYPKLAKLRYTLISLDYGEHLHFDNEVSKYRTHLHLWINQTWHFSMKVTKPSNNHRSIEKTAI